MDSISDHKPAAVLPVQKSCFFALPASLRTTLKHVVPRLLAGGVLFFSAFLAHATAPIGSTAGGFSVSPSGAATYSIPIFVPPGTHGMQPQLSLNYNSQGGNGLLGMGWSLGGLAGIHRCGATIAIDGFKGGVNYDANDRFCLDGERLIGIGGNEYRTQHESWQKIVAMGGTASDPSYFTVTTKDGTIQYYGATVDARIEAQGKTVARLWALNKIQDRDGNYLTITYTEDNANGDYRPDRIDYTGNGSVQPYNSVVFGYVDRTDIVPMYEAGSQIKIVKRLNRIYSYANTTLTRQYQLDYVDDGAMGRARLRYVTECGSDGVCLPKIELGWQDSVSNYNTENWPVPNVWAGAGLNFASDFNGDGKADLATANGAEAYVRLSTGNGLITEIWPTSNVWSYTHTWAADLNGDGKTDLATANGSEVVVRISTGNGFNTQTWQVPNVWGGTDYNWTGDFNGDGKTDLVTANGTEVVARIVSSPFPDHLISVTNGLGAVANVFYKPLTDSSVYTKDSSATYAYQDVQNPTYVVSQTTQSNGIGGLNTTNYQYAGLKTHHTAATSLGFRRTQTTDPAGLVHVTNYNQTLDCTEGTVASSETWTSGVRIKYTGNVWVPVSLGGGRCYARLDASVEETRELNNSVVSTVNTTHTYATPNSPTYAYGGNPTSVLVDFNDGWTKTTENTYTNDTVNWQLGRLSTSKVTATAPGQAAQYRESSFTYDGLGRLATEVIEPNRPALTLTTTYGYDAFGNRVTKTLSGPDITTRTAETLTYDAKGQFVTTRKNALNHTESFTYDARTGAVTTATDANNLTTTYTYNDGFGRKTNESRPGSPTTDIYYLCWDGSVPASGVKCPTPTGPAITAVRTVTAGAGENYVYSDILGRAVQANTQGFGGNWAYKQTKYDNLGRVTSTSHPYFNGEAVHCTTYSYDVLGRVLTSTEPGPTTTDCNNTTGGRVTTTAYNGLTTQVTSPPTTASPSGQVRTLVKNSQGQAVSVSDNAGTTTNTYDPFGNLTRVSKSYDVGADTTMGYDIRGRKTSMQDPDMGNWTYAYNVLGELTSQTDAKAQTITMAYDVLGRMTSRALPNSEGTSTWTYDTATYGKGKLASVSNPSATETYVYDSLSRVSSQTTSIGGIAYTTSYTYDASGRPLTLTYPVTGFKLYNIYDAYGHLTEVRKDTATGLRYWKADIFDAHGRLTQETLGNGLISSRAYDHTTGDLQTIKTGTGTNPTSIQNSSYTFDALDNLTSRSWWDGTATRSETFGYDSLNRLTTVTGPANKTYGYAANGNLTAKTAVGTYTYPTNGIRPHAVTSTVLGGVTTSYGYDANGNMTSRAGRTIAYTAFNKPQTINGTSGSTTLTYDANHNRVMKAAPGSTTIYIGKLYEKVVAGAVTTQNHYIYAGANLVGTYASVSNNTTSTRYFHTDHLGSVEVITNETGGVVQRLSYDAFGKRRNANGTDASSITAPTTRGYTRHEHDDEVGLINMNAREYDPVLGRFITPDSIIPGAANSQSYNRYSYVLNNPLSMVDPSGNRHKKLKKALKKVAKITKAVVDPFELRHNKYVRIAVAAVAAYYTAGWATSSYWSWASTGVYELSAAQVYAGYAAGGAAGGATFASSNTLMAGGNGSDALKAGFRGGITGAVSGGVGSYNFGPANNFSNAMAQVGAKAFAGGVVSEINGGSFKDGFHKAGILAGFSVSAQAMRAFTVEQSSLNPNNTSGSSAWGVKVAGCREGSVGWCLGGVQQDGHGYLFAKVTGWDKGTPIYGYKIGAYSKGGFFDHVLEAFGGPHDALNSRFYYDASGNGGSGSQTEFWNIANVPVAAPFAAAGGLSHYFPGGEIFAGGR